MEEKTYLYPKWIRLWHWSNAIFFIVLIVTGLSMQYSSQDYQFIPFSQAVYWHNIAGILLIIDYIIFLTGNALTMNGKYYKVKRKGLIDRIKKQFYYYTIGIFKGEKAPFPVNEERKFNPLQKVAYVGAMYVLIPLVIVTGVALLFPEMIVHKVFGVSGTLLTSLLHIAVGFLLTLFLLIHVYFSTFGKRVSSNFKSMINGYHEGH
ncbi:MAG: cytochrome b/b6 domain-containing protein [Bacteroidales bacterium]|nr:cytochrome b/b6 domain-containing protein [Bacteroidales bacterium]